MFTILSPLCFCQFTFWSTLYTSLIPQSTPRFWKDSILDESPCANKQSNYHETHRLHQHTWPGSEDKIIPIEQSSSCLGLSALFSITLGKSPNNHNNKCQNMYQNWLITCKFLLYACKLVRNAVKAPNINK